MDLFIDTNVYLSFFHFAKDDLDALRKLSTLLKNGALRLHLPQQVSDEFWRNRDTKIADLLKRLRESPRLNLPRSLHGFAEYADVRDLSSRSETAHTILLKKAEEAARQRSFPADAVIQELFGLGQITATEPGLVGRARLRRDVGDPPGKRDSLGDAMNWETLLASVPNGKDLHFVSEDGDWVSPLDANAFNTYLRDEWTSKKGSNITYYSQLSKFLNLHFPDIKLAIEATTDKLIEELANSVSFAGTHALVASLERATDFTPGQIKSIGAAFVANPQVRKIMQDADLKRFIEGLIKTRAADFDPTNLAIILRSLERPAEDLFWDIPEGWATDESKEEGDTT